MANAAINDVIIISRDIQVSLNRVTNRYRQDIGGTNMRGPVAVRNVIEWLQAINNNVDQNTRHIISLSHGRNVGVGWNTGWGILSLSHGDVTTRNLQASGALLRNVFQRLRRKNLFLIGCNTATKATIGGGLTVYSESGRTQTTQLAVGKLFAKAGVRTLTVVGYWFSFDHRDVLAFGSREIPGNNARVHPAQGQGLSVPSTAHLYQTLYTKIRNAANNFLRE